MFVFLSNTSFMMKMLWLRLMSMLTSFIYLCCKSNVSTLYLPLSNLLICIRKDNKRFQRLYILSKETFWFTKKSLMSDNVILSLLTLPVELVYRILDNLDEVTILLSFRNVCTRLNIIVDTYYRYQVNFCIIFKAKLQATEESEYF